MSNNLDTPKGGRKLFAGKRRAAKAERQEGPDDKSGYRQKIQAKKMIEGSKSKSGCAPKLFLLALPFAAVGAYWFLSS
jgi:hypothetical protein